MSESPVGRLGRYQIIRRVAMGGMGEIHLAKQTGLKGFERIVILKTLLQELTEDEEFLEQFLDEARVAATLNHPNIVAIHELGQEGDTYFIAMEFIDGIDLGAVLKKEMKEKQPISPRVAALFIRQAAAGLDHAHHAVDANGTAIQLIHRDVSPHNIMVRKDGVVKVVDFGIAKASNRESRTSNNVVKGKLRYMSPEQLQGEALDMRSDQFSLGVVLWELLAGMPLFKGDTPMELATKVLVSEIPLPSQQNPAVPPALDAVVMRMLARNREERFPGCVDVAARLQAFLDGSGGAADGEALELVASITALKAPVVEDKRPGSGSASARSVAAKPVCPSCGKEQASGAKFCAECGKPMGNASKTPSAASRVDALRPAARSPSPAETDVATVLLEEEADEELVGDRTDETPLSALTVNTAPITLTEVNAAGDEDSTVMARRGVDVPEPAPAAKAPRPTPAATPAAAKPAAPAAPARPAAPAPAKPVAAAPPAKASRPAPAPAFLDLELEEVGPEPALQTALVASSGADRWVELDGGEPLETMDLVDLKPVEAPQAPPLPPFVGRAGERNAIKQALARAREGNLVSAVFVAEPGMGRTRLLLEARSLAEEAGFVAVTTVGNRCGTPVTLDLLRQLLLALGRELDGKPQHRPSAPSEMPLGWSAPLERVGVPPVLLARVQPMLDGMRPTEDLGLLDNRASQEAALTQVFISVTSVKPVCVLVDDLHLADARSLELLDEVMLRAPNLRLVLLGSGPAELDARLLARSPRVPLAGLAEPDLLAYVTTVLHAEPPTATTLRLLHQQSRGNPVVAKAQLGPLMQVAASTGMRRAGGGAPVLPPMPGTAVAVFTPVLDSLSENTQRFLETAAVLGPVFPVGWVERSLAEQVQLAAVLGECAEFNILEPVEHSQPAMMFQQGSVRDAVLRRLQPIPLRQVKQRLAEMLTRAPEAGRVDVVELRARLWLASAVPERGVEDGASAARACACQGAFNSAVELWKRTLNLDSRKFGAKDLITMEDAALSLMRVADAVEATCVVDPAEAALLPGPLLEKIPSTLASVARAHVLRQRGRVFIQQARWQDAEQCLTLALDAAAGQEPLHSQVMATQAAMWEARGDNRSALGLVVPLAASMARGGLVPIPLEVEVLLQLGALHLKARQVGPARQAFTAARERAAAAELRSLEARATVQLARVAETERNPAVSLKILQEALATAAAAGDALSTASALVEQARILKLTGNKPAAITAYRRVLDMARLLGRKELHATATQQLDALQTPPVAPA